MTISVPQKSLSQSIMVAVFPYLDENMGGLPASTAMLHGFFTAAHTLSMRGNYEHPLLLKAVVHIALNHPRYQAYRELEKTSNIPTIVTDLKISEIIKYYLLNGGFVLDRNLDLKNPAQAIEAFQCAYRSKQIGSLKNRSYGFLQARGSSEFHPLNALFLNDYRFLLQAAKMNHVIVLDPSYEIPRLLRNTLDRDFCLAMISKDGHVLRHASLKLRADRGIVLEAVRQNGYALHHVSSELQADREVVLEAVRQNGHALCFASSELKANREIVLEAVRQNGHALQHVSSELKANREVVLEAVRQNGDALQHVSSELQADREVVIEAVRQNGDALYNASPGLKDDREVVLAAVRQNGRALSYASPELQVDQEVVLAAAK